MRPHVAIVLSAAVSLLGFSALYAADRAEPADEKTAVAQQKLAKAFKKEWPRVQEEYPAVAMAFVRQDVALAAAIWEGAHPATAEATDRVAVTPLPNTTAAMLVATELHFSDCIRQFRLCDARAGSDGSYSVDEVHGCASGVSECWRSPPRLPQDD
jgi:hypothetical protein